MPTLKVFNLPHIDDYLLSVGNCPLFPFCLCFLGILLRDWVVAHVSCNAFKNYFLSQQYHT